MSNITLTWDADGSIESFSVYRAEQSMDTSNLPAPIATDITGKTYVDNDVVEGKTYFYLVTSNKGGQQKVSDEISVAATNRIYHTWLEFTQDGIVQKGTSKVTWSSKNVTFEQMSDQSYAARFKNIETYLFSNDADPIKGDFEVEMIYTAIDFSASFGAWYESRRESNYVANGQLIGIRSADTYIEFRDGSANWSGGSVSTDKHIVNKKLKLTFKRIAKNWLYYIDDELIGNLSVTDTNLIDAFLNPIYIGSTKPKYGDYYLNGYLHRWSLRAL